MRRIVALISVAIGLTVAPVAAQAAVDVWVDLSSQSMQVTTSNGVVYRWAISSGKKGFRTPAGSYRSQRLARMHYSRKYDDAPMPHSIFFRGGYAIHGTNAVRMLGRPASHGCIRLAPAHAAKLFALTQQGGGARITIGGAAPGDGRAYANRRSTPRPLAQPREPLQPMPAYAPSRVPAAPGFREAPRAIWLIDGAAPKAHWILR